MALITGKVPLVVFSGGFDSTAMLFTQLTKYAEVDIISAALHGQTNKTQRESDAIEGIIRTLRKIQKKTPQYLGSIRDRHNVVINGYRGGHCHSKLTQGVPWLSIATQYITRETDYVMLGYVKGDDGLTAFPGLQRAWPHLLDACGLDDPSDHRPELAAPFKWFDKVTILRWLSNEYLSQIIRHSSWCESMANGTDCGTCPSCEKMLRELNTWATFYPDEYQRYSPFKGRFRTMMSRRKKTLSQTTSK